MNTESVLKQGKRQNPLNTESVQKQENDKILKWSKTVPNSCLAVSRPFPYKKCLETGETEKSIEIMTFSRDFVVFLFQDTFECGMCLETEKQQQNCQNTLK